MSHFAVQNTFIPIALHVVHPISHRSQNQNREAAWFSLLLCVRLLAVYISDIEADVLDELDSPLELIC
jgi:hypothetical protein